MSDLESYKMTVETSHDRLVEVLEEYGGRGAVDWIYSVPGCGCVVLTDNDGYLDHYELVGGCEERNPVHGALFAYKRLQEVYDGMEIAGGVREDDGSKEMFDGVVAYFIEKITLAEANFS